MSKSQFQKEYEEYKKYKEWQEMLGCENAEEVIDFVMSNYLTEDEKCRAIADQAQQIKDLETKLAEKDELLEDYRQLVSKLKEELGNVDCEYKTQIFTLKRSFINECKEHRDFCRIADKKVKGLEQQLKEERKKVVQEIKDKISDGLYRNSYGETFIDGDIYEILEQIERGGNNENKGN